MVYISKYAKILPIFENNEIFEFISNILAI